MEFLLNRYRNLTMLLVVIAAQLLLLAYQVKSKQDVPLIRVWAVTAVTPMARVIEVVRRNTLGFVYDYLILVNVREQNRHLSEENGKLKLENQRLHTDLQTADRVKALVAYQAQSPSKTIHARVIAMGTGYNSQAVYIDRGTNSGVERGMAVVTPDGIIGKIIASYPTAALIMKVTDSNFAAGVISQKSHVRGTVKGSGQPSCAVDHIQNSEPLEQGEMFFTSGDDRIFPKGLPVGIATVVRQGRAIKEVVLEPSGLKAGLEEVLVIIEGVHQNIPDPKTASPTISMLPPPPETPAEKEKAEKAAELANSYPTDADRLRDKYRKIGEAQKHDYGQNGSNVPNYNIDLDKRPQTAPTLTPTSAPKPANTATPPAGTAPVNKPPAVTSPAPRPITTTTTTPASPVSGNITAPPKPVVPKPKPADATTAPPARPDATGGAVPNPTRRPPPPAPNTVGADHNL